MNTNPNKFTKTEILAGKAMQYNGEAWTLELGKYNIKSLITNPMVTYKDQVRWCS